MTLTELDENMSCYKLIITIIIAVSQKVKVSFEEGLNIKIKNMENILQNGCCGLLQQPQETKPSQFCKSSLLNWFLLGL